MHAVIRAVVLLTISNTFMTFAWYAHLRNLGHKPWLVAALVSWSIALCEYLFQVPANRIGYTVLSLSQLKIIQEVITLSVFVPFAILYMRQAWSWNYVWAALCLMGAVFFIFREPGARRSEPPPASCPGPAMPPLQG
ncbi:MAG: DMT family protein [Kiritimatiellae bacterium]|nr:DMT family protein [Kiritimatiellia bacterium]